MKQNILRIAAMVALLTGGIAIAQDPSAKGPRGQANGWGGPPQSAEERAARQAACLERNNGMCPQGGPRLECPGPGRGKGWSQGQGRGHGYRRGLRDGTGPRSADGTCPLGNAPQQRGRR